MTGLLFSARSRRSTFAAGLLPSVAAALLMMVPSAGAGAISSISYTAPFHHAQRSIGVGTSLWGCGAANAPYPSFSLKTGNGSFADAVRVPQKCPSASAGSTAMASSGVELYQLLPTLTKGSHTVFVNWTVTAAGWENLSMARCSIQPRIVKPVYVADCYEESAVDLFGYTWITDAATGQVLSQSSWTGDANETSLSKTLICYPTRSYWYNSSSPTPANGSFLFHGNASFRLPYAFSSSDSYEIVTEIGGWVESTYGEQGATWSGSISGDAHLIVGGRSTGISLISVTVV